MATEDARYRQSTQYKLWSFSPSQLAELREETNKLAKLSISERLTTIPQNASSADQSAAATPDPYSHAALNGGAAPADLDSLATKHAASKNDLPEFLTATDELQLLNLYTVELLRAADFCNLGTDIKATAAVFLRRFYVTNSIMTYPPAELLKTCLFFGSKAEGFFQNLGRFAEQFPNTTGEQILGGEFLLCQGIRFAFDVKHPFRALEGAVMALREMEGVEDRQVERAHTRAREILKFSPLVTDAYFHYAPSQIMLAALSIADESLVDKIMDVSFPSHESAGHAAHTMKNGNKAAHREAQLRGGEVRQKVVETIRACRDMLLQEPPQRFTEFWGTAASKDITKPIVKKLKKCRDPDRWDLVALQQARREAPTNGEKKDKKVVDDGDVFNASDNDRGPKRTKLSAASQDPFGGPL